MPPIAVEETSGAISIYGKDLSLNFNKASGALTSFKHRGIELLAGKLEPNFWRVPTDNDEGGKRKSFAQRWRNAGLDSITIKPGEMKAERIGPSIVSVRIKNTVLLKTGQIAYATTFTINGDGEVKVDNQFTISGDVPPLARVGMQLALPSSFNKIKWFGNGPFESYEDRKESAFAGVYSGLVADQHFPFVMPQETGNKTDVRWILIANDNGNGLLAKGLPLINVNVQDYSHQALNTSKISHYLYRGDKTYVNIDLKQMGLGGDDSWTPRVHPEYLLNAKTYSFTFLLKAVDNIDLRTEDPDEN